MHTHTHRTIKVSFLWWSTAAAQSAQRRQAGIIVLLPLLNTITPALFRPQICSHTGTNTCVCVCLLCVFVCVFAIVHVCVCVRARARACVCQTACCSNTAAAGGVIGAMSPVAGALSSSALSPAPQGVCVFVYLCVCPEHRNLFMAVWGDTTTQTHCGTHTNTDPFTLEPVDAAAIVRR